MNNKQLIKKLEQAYQVCRNCGFKYGVYSVGCSSVWEGVCDVCDETTGVTEARDYAYLVTGIRKLKLESKDPAPQPKAGDTWLRDDHPAGWYTYDGTEWIGLAPPRPFSELTKDFSPERKAKIKEQSKEVAKHMAEMTEEENRKPSYGPTEIGENHECKIPVTREPIMTDEDLDRVMNPSYLQGDIECKFTEYEVAFLNECLDTIQESHPSLSPAFADPDEVALFEGIEKKITELYEDHCVKYELSPAMKAYNAKYGTFGFDSELDTARWEGFRAGFREGEEG
jgi:hypothetical protein